jgi:hypothetical protein
LRLLLHTSSIYLSLGNSSHHQEVGPNDGRSPYSPVATTVRGDRKADKRHVPSEHFIEDLTSLWLKKAPPLTDEEVKPAKRNQSLRLLTLRLGGGVKAEDVEAHHHWEREGEVKETESGERVAHSPELQDNPAWTAVVSPAAAIQRTMRKTRHARMHVNGELK